MELTNIGTCAVIVIICWVVGTFIKSFLKNNEYDTQLIPAILMVVGGILAAFIFTIQPDYLGTTNIFDSILTGLISGFASTGAHELLKTFLPTNSEK